VKLLLRYHGLSYDKQLNLFMQVIDIIKAKLLKPIDYSMLNHVIGFFVTFALYSELGLFQFYQVH